MRTCNAPVGVLVSEDVEPPDPVKVELEELVNCPREPDDLNPQDLVELGFGVASVLVHQLLDDLPDGGLLPLLDLLLGGAPPVHHQHAALLGDVEGLDPVARHRGQVLDGLRVVVPGGVVLNLRR